MKHLFRLLLATLLLTAAQTSAQSRLRIPAKGAECEKWVAGAFAKGKVPPFSFVYGGVPSGKTIANWKYTVETLPATERNVTERVYTYTDPATGLAVECRVKTFADFNAMEWVLRFRNTSEENTPKIEQVKVVDIIPESTAKGAYRLHYADGSHVSTFTPARASWPWATSTRCTRRADARRRTPFPFSTSNCPREAWS